MSVPVISVAQMRQWEKASWAAGRVESEVIARVGEILAARIQRLLTPGASILILAGKGHNGDDARQALNHLDGFRVHLCEVADPKKALRELDSFLAQPPALIVDGLFGIGLNRPLDTHWKKLIEKINRSQIPVLSVDVPSGLNAETGEPEGAAIVATLTLTLGAPKAGLLLPAAWPYTGRLEVASDIGLVPCRVTSKSTWTLPEDFHHYPPPRQTSANKGDFGHLAIIAGSLGFHGAGVLTSRAAQRAHPGLVTLFPQESVYVPVAAQLQAVMAAPWEPDLDLPAKYKAILIGPGLADKNLPEQVKSMTRSLWKSAAVPMLVDASAMDWLPRGATHRSALRVITPHPGEAGRLLGISAKQVQADRSAALRKISRQFGNCWVILKGAQTLIGRATGEIRVNSSGNPELAQGGSGDVLSGYLAGLLAQSPLQADPLKTLAYGVWQHGAAADRLNITRRNWVVEDLVSEIGSEPPI